MTKIHDDLTTPLLPKDRNKETLSKTEKKPAHAYKPPSLKESGPLKPKKTLYGEEDFDGDLFPADEDDSKEGSNNAKPH